MAAPGTFLALLPQLDRFLHATIGMERNGMDLSVLSVLARVGYDPWTEAARLAELPRAAAADSLAATIACLPGESRTRVHARMVALCLVPLLPSKDQPTRGIWGAGRRHGSGVNGPLLAGAMLSAALAIGLLIGTTAWAISHARPPGVPDGALPASRVSPVEQPVWPLPGGL